MVGEGERERLRACLDVHPPVSITRFSVTRFSGSKKTGILYWRPGVPLAPPSVAAAAPGTAAVTAARGASRGAAAAGRVRVVGAAACCCVPPRRSGVGAGGAAGVAAAARPYFWVIKVPEAASAGRAGVPWPSRAAPGPARRRVACGACGAAMASAPEAAEAVVPREAVPAAARTARGSGEAGAAAIRMARGHGVADAAGAVEAAAAAAGEVGWARVAPRAARPLASCVAPRVAGTAANRTTCGNGVAGAAGTVEEASTSACEVGWAGVAPRAARPLAPCVAPRAAGAAATRTALWERRGRGLFPGAASEGGLLLR